MFRMVSIFETGGMPSKGNVYKESLNKIDWNPLWRQVFNEDVLIAESKRIYNRYNHILLIYSSSIRDGKWTEIKYVYDYEEYWFVW